MRNLWSLFFLIFCASGGFAQGEIAADGKVWVLGRPVEAVIVGADTMICYELPTVVIYAYRTFATDDERAMFRKYQRYASMVYPYAVEAVRTYRKLEQDMKDMKRGDRKQHISQLQSELKDRFEQPLKNLSRTQGKILIKMIERELKIPVYTVIKDLRGSFTAFYWNMMGSLYGYHLKQGYEEGEDRMLDIILRDFDIPDNI